jgi:hypothetical protein
VCQTFDYLFVPDRTRRSAADSAAQVPIGLPIAFLQKLLTYRSTAIEADEHLHHCLVYIDLNMVRAGVIYHPAQWVNGYRDIQQPPKRYALNGGPKDLWLGTNAFVEKVKRE